VWDIKPSDITNPYGTNIVNTKGDFNLGKWNNTGKKSNSDKAKQKVVNDITKGVFGYQGVWNTKPSDITKTVSKNITLDSLVNPTLINITPSFDPKNPVKDPVLENLKSINTGLQANIKQYDEMLKKQQENLDKQKEANNIAKKNAKISEAGVKSSQNYYQYKYETMAKEVNAKKAKELIKLKEQQAALKKAKDAKDKADKEKAKTKTILIKNTGMSYYGYNNRWIY
jgi:hypothetical protein